MKAVSSKDIAKLESVLHFASLDNIGEETFLSMTEKELLKKQLAEARAEIEELRLRLSNVTLMLQKEMTISGSLPNPKLKKEQG